MTQTVKHGVMNSSEDTPLCYRLGEEVSNLQLSHHRGLKANRLQANEFGCDLSPRRVNQRGYWLTLTAGQVDIDINLTEVLEDLPMQIREVIHKPTNHQAI